MRFTAILLTLSVVLVAGCGGGGGGGSTTPTLTYDGITTAATLTEDNTEYFFVNTNTRERMDNAGLSVKGTAPRRALLGAGNSLSHVMTGLLQQRSAAKAVQTGEETVYGALSGTALVSLSVDDVTGAFTGTITFSNYSNVAGTTIDGTATASGVYDIANDRIRSEVDTYNRVSFSGDYNAYVSGTWAEQWSNGYTAITVILNLVGYDRDLAIYEQLVDCQYDITATVDLLLATSLSETLSGRAFDSRYGYVDFAGAWDWNFASSTLYPIDGSVLLEGAGNSSAQASCTGTVGELRYQVDADGDTVYEIDVTGSWSNVDGW